MRARACTVRCVRSTRHAVPGGCAQVYETVDDDQLAYIKLYNLQSKVMCNRAYGRMTKSLLPFLASIHIAPRPIWLCRSGLPVGDQKDEDHNPSAESKVRGGSEEGGERVKGGCRSLWLARRCGWLSRLFVAGAGGGDSTGPWTPTTPAPPPPPPPQIAPPGPPPPKPLLDPPPPSPSLNPPSNDPPPQSFGGLVGVQNPGAPPPPSVAGISGHWCHVRLSCIAMLHT